MDDEAFTVHFRLVQGSPRHNETMDKHAMDAICALKIALFAPRFAETRTRLLTRSFVRSLTHHKTPKRKIA
jgi:hypothetical protein